MVSPMYQVFCRTLRCRVNQEGCGMHFCRHRNHPASCPSHLSQPWVGGRSKRRFPRWCWTTPGCVTPGNMGTGHPVKCEKQNKTKNPSHKVWLVQKPSQYIWGRASQKRCPREGGHPVRQKDTAIHAHLEHRTFKSHNCALPLTDFLNLDYDLAAHIISHEDRMCCLQQS